MIEFENLEKMSADLSLLQCELENPTKDTKGHNYKYAQLDQILKMIKPVLGKNGFSIVQSAYNEENILGVETYLIHKSGAFIKGKFGSKLDGGMLKGSQAVGSQTTYYRRYSLLSMLNLASEDDDGASSSPKSNSNTGSGHGTRMASDGQKKFLFNLMGKDEYAKHKQFIENKMTLNQAREKIEELNEKREV